MLGAGYHLAQRRDRKTTGRADTAGVIGKVIPDLRGKGGRSVPSVFAPFLAASVTAHHA
jgi:hypothetical protein